MIIFGGLLLILSAKVYELDTPVAIALIIFSGYVLYLGYLDVDARTRSRRSITKASKLADSISMLDADGKSLLRESAVQYTMIFGDERPLIQVRYKGIVTDLDCLKEFINDADETHLKAIRKYSGAKRKGAEVGTWALIDAGHAKEAHANEPAEILTSLDACWEYLIPGG